MERVKMVELKIMRPDDSGEYYTTEVHGRLNSYSFNTVHPNSFRREHEPTIAAIKNWVVTALGLSRRGIGNMNTYLTIGHVDNGLKVLIYYDAK